MGCSGSSSETESASGLSSTESAGKRCRFGGTTLETIPATPKATISCRSPPGLSRAAMRQARDAQKASAAPSISKPSDAADVASSVSSDRQCRFGQTPLQTEPKTPKENTWRALAKALGSPPGLSRASMRQARDACKADELAKPTWGSSQNLSVSHYVAVPAKSASAMLTISPSGAPMTPPVVGSAKRSVAREALAQARQGAALLKAEAEASKRRHVAGAVAEDGAAQTVSGAAFTDDLSDSEQTTDLGHTSASDDSASECSAGEGRRCRFGSTALETVPATPVGAAGCPLSPPGLSRAAMRKARDSCKADRPVAPSWGTSRSSSVALTISPCGQPVTPTAGRSAKQRAMRDAVKTGMREAARTRQDGATAWFSTSPQQAVTSAAPR